MCFIIYSSTLTQANSIKQKSGFAYVFPLNPIRLQTSSPAT